MECSAVSERIWHQSDVGVITWRVLPSTHYPPDTVNKALLESSLPTINSNTSSAADRAWTNSCFLLGFTPTSAISLHSVSSRSCRDCALIMINQSLKENTGNENVNYTVSLVHPQNRWEIQLTGRGRRIMCEMFTQALGGCEYFGSGVS